MELDEYQAAFDQSIELVPTGTKAKINADIDKICRPIEFMCRSKALQHHLAGMIVALGVFIRLARIIKETLENR